MPVLTKPAVRPTEKWEDGLSAPRGSFFRCGGAPRCTSVGHRRKRRVRRAVKLQMEEVLIFAPNGGGGDASPIRDTELRHAPSTVLESKDNDYLPIHNFKNAKNVIFVESTKLWAIVRPIAFNILRIYGANSFTNIFVGHEV
ncbi:hypothetical protein U1Q18_039714 [Sarracenia purpurea var. burkii]